MKKRMSGRKRVTLSLPAEMVRRLDERSRRTRSSRSATVAALLSEADRAEADRKLAAEVEAYYKAGDDDPGLTRWLGKVARTLRVDE